MLKDLTMQKDLIYILLHGTQWFIKLVGIKDKAHSERAWKMNK